jgi:hypothetical protein
MTLRRIILRLQVIGVVVLLFCAVGYVLLGDWGSVALALAAAILLLMA